MIGKTRRAKGTKDKELWKGIVRIENEPIGVERGTLFDVATIHGMPQVKGMIVTDENTVEEILTLGTKGRASRTNKSNIKGGIGVGGTQIGGEGTKEEVAEYPKYMLIGTIFKISGGKLIEQMFNKNYVLVENLSQISFIRPGQPEQDERIV